MCCSFAEAIGYPQKQSEFIDLVAVVEVSVVVGVVSAVIVETHVGLTTIVEVIRPSVAELEKVSHIYLSVGEYLPMLLHCPPS